MNHELELFDSLTNLFGVQSIMRTICQDKSMKVNFNKT